MRVTKLFVSVGIVTLVFVFVVGLGLMQPQPVIGQSGDSGFKILKTPPWTKTITKNGQNVKLVTVRFTIVRDGNVVEDFGSDYKIKIYEEGHYVATENLPKPKVSADFSVVLVMDTSGSMNSFGRMEQAQKASRVFFANLPKKTRKGLILFNHAVHTVVPIGGETDPLMNAVSTATPKGGTAYLDACIKAVEMLKREGDRAKAIVVMTDGMDLNSKAKLAEVINVAAKYGIRIYPIGIGEPGRQTPVTSVLVLDKSASMELQASETDRLSKIDALKAAAIRFVSLIPETKEAHVQSTIVHFNDKVYMPFGFTNNKSFLNDAIRALTPEGETAFIDAIYDAVATLEAKNPTGKRAVITLADGVDNKSHRRKEEVIRRANEAGIKLFMLGFGKKKDLQEGLMREMAATTGGAYYHAGNQQKLLEIFEDLSIQIHDDGIDEVVLKKLAKGTRGAYYPAKDVNKLEFMLKAVAQDIVATEFKIVFKSKFQHDVGPARNVSLQLVRVGPDGQERVIGGKVIVGPYFSPGLVLAQMSPSVYLGFLTIFALLIVVPFGLGRLRRSSAEV